MTKLLNAVCKETERSIGYVHPIGRELICFIKSSPRFPVSRSGWIDTDADTDADIDRSLDWNHRKAGKSNGDSGVASALHDFPDMGGGFLDEAMADEEGEELGGDDDYDDDGDADGDIGGGIEDEPARPSSRWTPSEREAKRTSGDKEKEGGGGGGGAESRRESDGRKEGDRAGDEREQRAALEVGKQDSLTAIMQGLLGRDKGEGGGESGHGGRDAIAGISNGFGSGDGGGGPSSRKKVAEDHSGGGVGAVSGGFPGAGLFSFMAPGNSISTIDKFTEVR